MRISRRAAWALAPALWLAACVPVEEPLMPKNLVQKAQPTLVVAYAAPGPLILEEDNKAETAAKIMPGLGILMQGAQNDRVLRDSKDLQQYLPLWKPDQAFMPFLRAELSKIGYAGVFISTAEAAIPAEDLKRLNESTDQVDWRDRYYLPPPEGTLPRDYSKYLSLDNALVLDVNLLYGLTAIPDEPEGKMSPTLAAQTRFYRADSMRLFWFHEDEVEDKAGAQNPYDFKLHAQTLIDSYGKLLPQLAQKVAANFKQGLSGAAPGVAASTGAGISSSTAAGIASSTSTAMGVSSHPFVAPPYSSTSTAVMASTAAYQPPAQSAGLGTVSPSTSTAH